MIKIKQNLRWIYSTGGPLILMPKSSLLSWNGNKGWDKNTSIFVSDYDRACEIEEYLGIIKVADKEALVLGDLPSHTSFVSIDLGKFILVRWIWAENEEQVECTLKEMLLDLPWIDTKIRISFDSDDLTLFDSVFSGDEIIESLNIKVDVGDYGISTLEYQPNEQVNLFLILLKKIT